MIDSQKPQPAFEQVQSWLTSHYDTPVIDLEPISGGFWSSAYGFNAGNENFVLRLSDSPAGFEIDKMAMRFSPCGVPVPEVIGIGEALGLHYAVSRRHYGQFLELVDTNTEKAGNALANLLVTLRSVPSKAGEPVNWCEPRGEELTWRQWLLAGLESSGKSMEQGWCLEENAEAAALFNACEQQIEALLPFCPERRDLIHGDLLHQNVLLAADHSVVTAAFSWKCSAKGDFIYDIAWCTLWSNWFPGIKAMNMWERTLKAEDMTPERLKDARLRHHCYELQIAASHIHWYLWTEDEENLTRLLDCVRSILARGPLD